MRSYAVVAAADAAGYCPLVCLIIDKANMMMPLHACGARAWRLRFAETMPAGGTRYSGKMVPRHAEHYMFCCCSC